MTKVKICGLSRMADIEAVNRHIPDFAGFVFAKSRRQVDADTASKLISALNHNIRSVGVFVNSPVEDILKTARLAGLDIIQLHGDEDAGYISNLRKHWDKEIWKAIRVSDSISEKTLFKLPADRFLLDAFSPGVYGGTGQTFDWNAINISYTDRVIIAGGINHSNAANAVKRFSPYCIDISSGAETDGFKDEEKIKQCINNIREVQS
ncbi:MAG: phosphoribosylanthranilate isomerase [Bacillota bacterium]|nr:phosphoribosylanthranilate isomerase [Bacillota bacterium]